MSYTIKSIVEDGDILIENNLPDKHHSFQAEQVALSINKQIVPKHQILLSVVGIVFYLLFNIKGLLILNLFLSTGVLILIFLINKLFFDEKISFLTTILYASNALFYYYSNNFSPDLLSTLLLLMALFFTIKDKFILGMFFLALAITAKVTNAIFILPFTVYLVCFLYRIKDIPHRSRTIVFFILKMGMIFIISILPFLIYNFIIFGDPLITGYQRAITLGLNNEIVIINHINSFTQPFFIGFVRLLFHMKWGIVFTNPILITAFMGIFYFIKKSNLKSVNPALIFLFSVAFLQLIFFAKYDMWFTSHFSNRFLMTFVAIMSLGTSYFISSLKKNI